jgi:hypothetical protein
MPRPVLADESGDPPRAVVTDSAKPLMRYTKS